MSGGVKVARLPAVDSNVPNSYVNDDGEANLDRTNVRNENPVRLAVVILGEFCIFFRGIVVLL
jgi:hypothetical protein